MKLYILDNTNKKVGEINLPRQFHEDFRPDLIKRAVLAIQSHKRQPYAASTGAGKRASAKLSRRRRDYKTSYGFGISRVPRKIISRRGSRMNWVGAFAPGTVGGRRAHPPKTDKSWSRKINDKERIKAMRSAISATILRDIVAQRGHSVPEKYPFVLDGKFEFIEKTSDAVQVLQNLGFEAELQRTHDKSIRHGKGKSRGRKYKRKKGPLVVISKKNKIYNALKNISGVDIVEVRNLNTELLAPGAKPGRLTLWTSSAIDILEKENLFNK